VFRNLGFALALLLGGAFVTAQQTPTFRGGTEIVTIDVSVLDDARRPVTGLTAGDFAVTIDGKTRPVVAFKEVAPPPPPPVDTAAAPWVRDVAPDVVNNAAADGRLVVILIDDYTFLEGLLDQWTIIKARETAHAVVDQLGPSDRAAIVFADNNHSAQTFTSDRRLLHKSIDDAALFPRVRDSPTNTADSGACLCGVCPIKALEQIARGLRSVPERRKIVMYVSGGSNTTVPQPIYGQGESAESEVRFATHCLAAKRDALHDALRQLQISNVTVQSIDPKGLDPRSIGGGANNPYFFRVEFLRTVAESTGGRAVVHNNDMELQVPAVLAESSSYYLLGVERPLPDPKGEMHPIRVTVNRRDVEVRTRKGYFDESEKDLAATAAALAKGNTTPMMAGAIQSAGIPLELAAAPFLGPDGEAALAMALSVSPPSDSAAATTQKDAIDLTAALFFPETGEAPRSQKQRVDISWSGGDPRFRNYEVLSRLPAKPGRYELRSGAQTSDGRTASLYTSVEIPNFHDDLSLSGLILSAKPSAPAAPPDILADLLPFAPTSRRTFKKDDQLLAFMRIYQKTPAFATATVKTRLTDAKGEVLADQEEKIEGDAAGTRSFADYKIELPLSDLGAGEYLLSVDVSVGTGKAQRQLRFKVEP
jgi:VWFA-related protein